MPKTNTISTSTTEVSKYRPRLLIAEDESLVGNQLKDLLEHDLDVQIDVVNDGKQALEHLKKHFYSLFLTDLKMPHIDGLKLLHEIQDKQIPVSVVVMTAHGSVEGVVEAMKAGAKDFLTKPLDLDYLKVVLKRTLANRAMRDELVYLREQLESREAFQHILTRNPRMLEILALINNLAQVNTTVLIEGETGTGKELIAHAIHQVSAKHRSGLLVPVNCAALPPELIESELFGHEKGSFTGAVSQRVGKFERASGGTLFLDEVAEIPMDMQVKLLRALQERNFERVGGTQSIDFDTRIVAATNRSLARMVKKNAFREDLYYRINVVRIDLPPLRERPEDIPLLVNHFCQKFVLPGEKPKQFAPSAMEALLQHTWPGNVRELENVIERACVTTKESVIEKVHEELLQPPRIHSPYKVDLSRPLPELLKEINADFEKRYIKKALAKSRGHVGRCAKICGLSRRSITAKLAEYDIDKDQMKDL